MKLAEIPNTKEPMALLEYASIHNYAIREYITFSEFPQIVFMFNICVERAKQEGCIEVILHEVKDHFNLMNDKHNWRLSIIGFALKN